MAKVKAETREIVPRYYGLVFHSGTERIFDDPLTAAVAYVAITSPEKQGGLTDMLGEWQARKPRELAGEFPYAPLFTLNEKQAKRLLVCSKEKLVEIVRDAIHGNHGSYNLWDCYGAEAVSELMLRGEALTAEVKSQKEGWHSVNLKGAVRGRNGEIRYADSFCDCSDNRWTQLKGGQAISFRRNCLHVKEAELDSYQQFTQLQPPARLLMREKERHKGEPSLTFNFVNDPFLRHLIADVLIAREVLGMSAYEIDRKLLTEPIASAITPLSVQQEVARGAATFEILRQKDRRREIDSDLLKAQVLVDEVTERVLRKEGYQWRGHCLEFGLPAIRYEHPENMGALSLVFSPEGLPFYVARELRDARKVQSIFNPDYGPTDLFQQPSGLQGRIDDRTRQLTRTRVGPATKIILPEKRIDLTKDLPTRVLNELRKKYMEAGSGIGKLRTFGLQN